MYAVISTGGKQYTVSEGDVIKVEKLTAQEGDKINLDVLMFADGTNVNVGSPVCEGVKCEAEVLGDGKEKKIVVFKYKSKKNVRKRQGHRQPFTELKILSIKA